MNMICVNCERPISVHSASAWPESCPYCHTSPLSLKSEAFETTGALGRVTPIVGNDAQIGAVPG
jgi:hypothetical protein